MWDIYAHVRDETCSYTRITSWSVKGSAARRQMWNISRVKMDLNLKKLAHDRFQWRTALNTAVKLLVP